MRWHQRDSISSSAKLVSVATKQASLRDDVSLCAVCVRLVRSFFHVPLRSPRIVCDELRFCFSLLVSASFCGASPPMLPAEASLAGTFRFVIALFQCGRNVIYFMFNLYKRALTPRRTQCVVQRQQHLPSRYRM